LFVGVALTAIVLAWTVAQRQWMHDRQEARDWAQSHTRVNISAARGDERLPIGLRLLGERPLGGVEVDIAFLDASESHRVEQIRELFPEAKVLVKQSRRQKESFVEALLSEISAMTRAIKPYLVVSEIGSAE
jgi:hypothetical protein